jgi:hypothetical protein
MTAYDPWRYRCCQHNVAFGWPYYAEHLWLATQGNGLAAVMYAPCEVTAKVADGTRVTITEETDYPFGEQVAFKISCENPAAFPLMLRIPNWCRGARISINGQPQSADLVPGHYAVIERTWKSTDTITLELPMQIELRQWSDKASRSVSIYRGPLAYSLRIGERWEKIGGKAPWFGYEVFPTTPWNYGLIVDPKNPDATIQVDRRQPVSDQPFTPDDAPITLKAKARRVPEWKLEQNDVAELPKSPIASDAAREEVTLVPMGCARLRISAFPWLTP